MKNQRDKGPPAKAVPYFNSVTLLLLSFAGTLSIVLPATNKSIINLLFERWFYLPLVATYCVALLISNIINLVTLWLDRHYSWEQEFRKRLVLQLSLGWVFPSCLAFVTTYFYFSYLGVNIMATLYSRHMFPLIIAIILVMNILYFGYYYAYRLMENQRVTGIATVPGRHYSDCFLLPEGSGITKVPVNNLAYFYRKDDNVLVRTCDKNIYMVSLALDDIESGLDPELFCRVNRSFIISRRSFSAYRKRPDGGLMMYLEPDAKQAINVSRNKTKAVLEWLREEKLSTKST